MHQYVEAEWSRRKPGIRRLVPSTILVAVAVLLAACSSGANTSSTVTTTTATPQRHSATAGTSTTVTAAPEALVPGDIPDTIAYIPYTNAAAGYTFVHPEGWALQQNGPSATFTDKYNGVSASVLSATAPPTVASAQGADVPALAASQPAFTLVSVSPATLPGGTGVLIIYRRNSPPDPVTDRSVRQEVHRYEIFGTHRAVALDLYGAVRADNVDPYARMSQSLRVS
jgi:hypothetical protein